MKLRSFRCNICKHWNGAFRRQCQYCGAWRVFNRAKGSMDYFDGETYVPLARAHGAGLTGIITR